MIAYSLEKLSLFLYVITIIIAMVWSPVWYIHPALIVGSAWIWKEMKSQKTLVSAFFLAGQVSAISVWYASPLFSGIIQCLTAGILICGVRIPFSGTERRLFIIFCVLIAAMMLISHSINHTAIPVILCLSLFSGVILYFQIAQYRLKKKYSGDMS